MTKSVATLLLLLLAFFSIASEARAGTDPKATPLNGQWKGPLQVPGGYLTMLITIVPLTNGTYYATLDVPQQRISRMPVEVELDGTAIKLRIEQAGSSFEGKVLDDGAALNGIWKQPGFTVPLVLQREATSTVATTRLRLTPPYRETEVTFTNPTAKIKLSGTLTEPAGEGPFAGVVLLSDTGPHNREVEQQDYQMFGQLADYLTRHGIAVLRFDDRGVGKSGGKYAGATTADLMTDAQAALAFMRTRPLISPHRVGLLGHGEGANVALLAAASSARFPDFVVSLAGYGQSGYDVLLRQQGEIMRLIGADQSQVKAAQEAFARTVRVVRATANNAKARAEVAALLTSANMGLDASMANARAGQLTSPWSRYFFDFDPKNTLGQVKCAVLLLNGSEDLQVSASRNMTVLQKTLRQANRKAEAYKLKGVNHLFQDDPATWPLVNGAPKATFSPEALKLVREWVMNETKLPNAPLPVTVKRPEPPKPVAAKKPVAKKVTKPAAAKPRASR